MKKFQQFLKDEDGAITIEWVALAAGVILLAIGIIAILEPALENAAANIAADVENIDALIDAAQT